MNTGRERNSHEALEGIMDEKRITIEERLNHLEYATHDLSSLAEHIYGVLFGMDTGLGDPLPDHTPSVDLALFDIECHVRDASKILEEIAERLSDKKRLKIRMEEDR